MGGAPAHGSSTKLVCPNRIQYEYLLDIPSLDRDQKKQIQTLLDTSEEPKVNATTLLDQSEFLRVTAPEVKDMVITTLAISLSRKNRSERKAALTGLLKFKDHPDPTAHALFQDITDNHPLSSIRDRAKQILAVSDRMWRCAIFLFNGPIYSGVTPASHNTLYPSGLITDIP